MISMPNGNDIQRWYPESFSEIVGNRSIVEYFSQAVRLGHAIPNTLTTGESRSGKSSGVKAFAKCVLCLDLNVAELRACGKCQSCKDDLGRSGNAGIFAHFHMDAKKRREPVHFISIDCTQITESELKEQIADLQDYHGRRIIHLDEIHRLRRRGLDELLLKPLEDRNFTWIATSAVLDGLEPMFLKRFPVKLRTTLPSRDEMAIWLADRCESWSIRIDEARTILRLVDRSHHSPGLALHVLAFVACLPARTLTKDIVEDHCFDVTE